MINCVETTLDTDFAILQLQQSENWIDGVGTFALSAPGAVHVTCGTKYARVHVRAERWDARPPFDESWEDYDELPFTEVAGDGPLIISGFDPGDVGLDVDGIGDSRVQVFARGRHRYDYGNGPSGDEFPPEEWLFRFFPVDGRPGPFSGGPRRLAGGGGLYSGTSDPWSMAHRAVDGSGWYALLWRSASFGLVHRALWGEHRPATADDVARRMRSWRRSAHPDDVELLDHVVAQPLSEADPLAELTGRATPLTVGQAVDALRDLGLLLVEERQGRHLLIPNPAPEPAWLHQERSGADAATVRNIRMETLRHVYQTLATDLQHAIRWAAEEGVWTSVEALALRQAATIDEVTGALRYLIALGTVVSDADLGLDAIIEAEAPLWLRATPRPQ